MIHFLFSFNVKLIEFNLLKRDPPILDHIWQNPEACKFHICRQKKTWNLFDQCQALYACVYFFLFFIYFFFYFFLTIQTTNTNRNNQTKQPNPPEPHWLRNTGTLPSRTYPHVRYLDARINPFSHTYNINLILYIFYGRTLMTHTSKFQTTDIF